jgi:hypothetical protein
MKFSKVKILLFMKKNTFMKTLLLSISSGNDLEYLDWKIDLEIEN